MASGKELKENCHPEAGELRPIINQSRCEGKNDCVEVCPYNVFELRKLTDEEKKSFSFMGRLKLAAHGGNRLSQCGRWIATPAGCASRLVRRKP